MASASPKLPFSTTNVQLNSVNNFNNHHLYQSYNPITGGKFYYEFINLIIVCLAYQADKQQANQMRSTFRYAANNVLN